MIPAVLFAAWAWLKPYSWNSDPAARCKVVETLVTRDGNYYWVNIHLNVSEGSRHDLRQLVRLVPESAPGLPPADTTFAGPQPENHREIWFKFWLARTEIARPLRLQLNQGQLVIKTSDRLPDLADRQSINFTSDRW